MSRLRRNFYRAARDLGDIEAIGSGNPGRVAKRIARKKIYRTQGRLTRRWLRKFGL